MEGVSGLGVLFVFVGVSGLMFEVWVFGPPSLRSSWLRALGGGGGWQGLGLGGFRGHTGLYVKPGAS